MLNCWPPANPPKLNRSKLRRFAKVRADVATRASPARSRRKEAYEALHPETAHGAIGNGREKSRQVGDSTSDRFTADTATKTGESERSGFRSRVRRNLKSVRLSGFASICRETYSGTVTPMRPALCEKSAPASTSATRMASTEAEATALPVSNRAQVMRDTPDCSARSGRDHCSAARAMRDCVGVMVIRIVSQDA